MLNTTFIKEVGLRQWIVRTCIRQFHKRVLRRPHALALPNGVQIKLPVANKFASEVFITKGNVDWGSEHLLYTLLKTRGVFLDVGAHIGYYSLYMHRKVQAVHCFEPDPRARKLLEVSLKDTPNVQIYPYAVGARSCKVQFTMDRDAELSHLANTGDRRDQQIEVDMVSIDSFVAERRLGVEAIKIDVEGHDHAVIAGAEGVLRTQQPIVLTEARPDAELFDLVARLSYQIFAFVRDPVSRRKWFARICQDTAVQGHTKMLFLVPEGRATEIVAAHRL